MAQLFEHHGLLAQRCCLEVLVDQDQVVAGHKGAIDAGGVNAGAVQPRFEFLVEEALHQWRNLLSAIGSIGGFQGCGQAVVAAGLLELAASLLQQLRCRGANADAAGGGLTLTADGGQLGLRGRADAGAGLGDGGELLEEGIERFAPVTREQVDVGAIAEPFSPQRQLVAMQLEGLEAELITAEGQNAINGLG